MPDPKEIYNNGALKIVHKPIKVVEFGLFFKAGNTKLNLFLTKEQVLTMYEAMEQNNASLAQLE